jgi:acyl carrier protein/malonyl CoA-acyl carrier protein transacylase
LTEPLSLPSLFPVIFNESPIDDIVTLHCVLFAIQYSCAKSWLDSGVKVDRLIGHSFGQLTALAVSGALSLTDAIKLISKRAKLMQAHLGSENGFMLAVEGEASDVDALLGLAAQRSQHFTAEIACYNGPRSFVIAGSEASIQAIMEASETLSTTFRFKRLKNSHAFHTQLLDPILPQFLEAASEVQFLTPTIPIEACSNEDEWSEMTAEKIVRHTRMPVDFMNAVRNIEQQMNEPITWLEAGSGSPVVPMIKRAINSNHKHTYIATALQGSQGPANLTKAVCRLWSNGVRAQFWPFHRSQHSAYNWINLPPYQFAKTSHWLDYKPRAAVEAPATAPAPTPVSLDLVTLLPSPAGQSETLFEINPNHELYQLNTKGHEVVDQTLVPASLYNEFVLTASRILSTTSTGYVPHISSLSMSSPLVVNPVGRVLLKMVDKSQQPGVWNFTLYTQVEDTDPLTHATGSISISNPAIPVSISHFQALQSLMLHRCEEIESSPLSTGFKGPTAYQAMRRVVTYLDYYHGIQKIFTLGNEVSAYITMPPARPNGMGVGFCDPVLVDSFTQVSGILANCFSLPQDGGGGEMWVCNYISDVVFTQRFIETAREENKTWLAYSKFDIPTPKHLKCNIFVFEPQTGDIVLTIMSIEFQKVSIKSLKKVLGKLNSQKSPSNENPVVPIEIRHRRTETAVVASDPTKSAIVPQPEQVATVARATTAISTVDGPGSLQKVKEMLRDILEIPINEITPDGSLEALGVDSLLATELFSEINSRFGISISHSEFATVKTVQGISQLITGSSQKSNSTVISVQIPQLISLPAAIQQQTIQRPQLPVQETPRPVQNSSPTLELVREMLVDVMEIPIMEIEPTTTLETLGVDSLMATELFSETNKRFGVSISHTEFALVSTVRDLAQLVAPSNQPAASTILRQPTSSSAATPIKHSSQIDMETIVFAERDGTPLSADIYCPEGYVERDKVLPIGG